MTAPAQGPLDDAIAEIRSQVLDLQMAGDPASAALAADLSGVVARHTGQAPAPAAHVVANPPDLVVGVIDDQNHMSDGYDDEDDYLDEDYEEMPEPNRLVVSYSKHDPIDGPFTETELQAVLADAQAALELIGLGRIVVVDTLTDDENPNATVVHYEVLEAGEVPLTSVPTGVGAGVVAGIGRVNAHTTVAYVEPAAA